MTHYLNKAAEKDAIIFKKLFNERLPDNYLGEIVKKDRERILKALKDLGLTVSVEGVAIAIKDKKGEDVGNLFINASSDIWTSIRDAIAEALLLIKQG